MPQNDMNQSGSGTKIIIVALIAGVVMIVALLYGYNRDDENAGQTASPMESVAVNMHEKVLVDAQQAAAMAAISGKTVSSAVTQRPDYVSETEWQVLQNVVKQHPNGSEKQLTNLVNKLLFSKKKEAWLSSGENTAQRRQLARQLLDMIPEQLETEAIDSATAKEMERKLAADLI
ncbi:MAG: hypothetical protein CVU55_10740 [Deltaproteobacteria bacterium HGW-Deltaproteobacteria-13]|nr:MAG: hypothetical protein CVU55_10740 [Deltaproteobacteria bacterium HGW-Deltaproteobacteria-13]